MSDEYVIDEVHWTIELNITCPKCENYFDYLNTVEYREDGCAGVKHAQPDPCANIEVICPECGASLFIRETFC